MAVLAMIAAGPAPAQAADPLAVPAPSLRPGDGWVYRRTHEQGPAGFTEKSFAMRVERVDGDTMVVGIKPDGADLAFEDHRMGSDWSQRRIINGLETVTGCPFDFPMTAGKTWTVDFTEPKLTGPTTSVHFHTVFKAVGWEDVETPAGKFRALKIQGDGTIDVDVAARTIAVGGGTATPSNGTAVSQAGRIPAHTEHSIEYQELYYAPAVKYYVKTLDELYNSQDVRVSRDTQVLMAFTPAP
jgi:hypothetical protein